MPCAVNPLRPSEPAAAALAQHSAAGWLCPHVSCVVLGDFPLWMKERNVQAALGSASSHSSQELQQQLFLSAGTHCRDNSAHSGPSGMEACLFRPIYFGI